MYLTAHVKIVRIMKLMAILLFVACLQVSAKSYSQTITLSVKDSPLENVLNEIKKQSGYQFFLNESMLAKAKPVTLDVKNAPLEEVLRECFADQPFSYSIVAKTVVLKDKPLASRVELESVPPSDIHGRITDSLGNPLAGASIYLKGTKKGTISDVNGNFILKNIGENQVLVFSFTGYTKKEYKVTGSESINVSLSKSNNPLDAVVVIPYGTTTQRLNTGDVSTVTAKIIEEQPVSNVLAALEGQVPGLVITQTTGQPGGSFNVQIRGQNSLINGTNPFYVVDGVPYNATIPASNGLPMAQGLINSTLNGGSPLNYLNPYDIESVEVLKDADATAIYGSRAANGAILITTKKGKAGPMKIDVNVNSGISSPARDIKLLNTQQYLSVRHEAFNNDGELPTTGTAPDLLVWDTTRYTDWSKVLLQNHAAYTNANASVSGGNGNTQYLIGGGYNLQTSGMPTLIPNQGKDQKGSAHFNINNTSIDKRFKLGLTGSFLSDVNTISIADLSQQRFGTPPDGPPLYNPDGSLNWAPISPGQRGTWTNPISALYQKYQANTSNLISNANIGYTLIPGLELKASLGYTFTQIDEVRTGPTYASDPGANVLTGTSFFGSTNIHSWIIEPQAEYKLNLGKGIFSALVGGSFYENNSSAQSLTGRGYISNALLESTQAAASLTSTSSSTEYKYDAFFGRLGYNWQDKYIINLNGRRDGSSRFGPGKQYGNFGSVGAAWIFSQENFIKQNLGFLSFGKLRASYGTTGNDQIGDYQYLDLYSPTDYPYITSPGLFPRTLFNPDLAWEIDKKAEVGIMLGFLKDRITVEASFYRNRSDNQLVSTPVSLVTGYASIPSNLPATVQNTGQEFMLRTINIQTKSFSWLSTFSLTLSQNKLVSFPGLSTSPYQNQFVIGQPITVKKVFHLVGVNDTSGIYQFSDAKGVTTNNPDYSSDLTTLVNTTPKYYGGFLNSFSYKGLSLDIFFQFVKQTGLNIFGAYGRGLGAKLNMPVSFLNHWQKPGDKAKYEMATQDNGSDASNALNYALQSDFAYGDASFIRLKNLAISWQLPGAWKQKIHLQNCRIYFNAQNLFIITKYDGIDPETQSYSSPTSKVWVLGIQITL